MLLKGSQNYKTFKVYSFLLQDSSALFQIPIQTSLQKRSHSLLTSNNAIKKQSTPKLNLYWTAQLCCDVQSFEKDI